ncbi:MRPL27 (predicted) [Pycnogonum litorale]
MMAAVLNCRLNVVLPKTIGNVRYLTQNNQRRPKHYGFKKMPGNWARQGSILVKQPNLRYHPGLNVAIARDRSLFACADGKVVLTLEKFVPDKQHHYAQEFYGDRFDQPIYKKYFHVIPPPEERKFRLVAAI